MHLLDPGGSVNEATHTGRSTLHLGTARVVISPPIGTYMSGFIARTAPMQGIHDELYARAMVWADKIEPDGMAALLTLDILGLDTAIVEAIRARVTALTGMHGDRVALSATHTHGGPVVLPERAGEQRDEHYLGFLINAAAGAVAAAARNVTPATMSFAVGSEPSVGKNRRVPNGPIDPDVPVLRFHGSDGQVRGLLLSYACHPVTLGPDNLLATADYPGYAVRTLESVYPDALVQFATGCCGQINTGHQAHDSVAGRGYERRTFAEAERLGRVVAAAALQAAERAAPPAGSPHADESQPAEHPLVRAASNRVELPLLPADPPDVLRTNARAWRAEAARLHDVGGPLGERLLLQQWAAWAETTAQHTDVTRSVMAEVMVIALRNVVIVMLPGEAFVELGLEIKQRSGHSDIIVIAYANGAPGYLPHRSAYAEGGYEVTEAYRFYGYPAGFAPEAAERLVEAAVRLVREVKESVISGGRVR